MLAGFAVSSMTVLTHLVEFVQRFFYAAGKDMSSTILPSRRGGIV